MPQSKLHDISILRGFSIIVVVIFHTYGMMYADHFIESKEIYYDKYYQIIQCGLINLAMPLFVFLSGYVFNYLKEKGKYASWSNLMRKKGLRIWIPYFYFSLIMMVGTNNYAWTSLFAGTFWHLWFLPMLFWCFIIGNLYFNIKNQSLRIIILIALFIVSLFETFLPKVLGISSISAWSCWFILGMEIFYNRKLISGVFKKYYLAYPLLLLGLAINLIKPTPYADRNWYLMLSQIMLISSLWSIFHSMSLRAMNKFSFIEYIDKYCFGIFIFHSWIAVYLISSTSQKLFNLPVLATNHVILFPLVFFLLTFALSLLVSILLHKTKIGKFLIG